MVWWSDSGPGHPDEGSHIQTDYHNETPMFALLRAIAVLEDCEMEDLPSLHEYIDLNALNRLMRRANAADQEVTVKVDIEDYTAVVRDDGTITVHEADSSDEDAES